VTHHRTDRTIASIVGLAEGLTTKLPAARAVLAALIHTIDGYPVGTDAPKVTATTELTTVEQAADQRIRLTVGWDGETVQRNLRWIAETMDAAVRNLSDLHRECDRIIGEREAAPRCSGGVGREGALEWGRPDCWEVPRSVNSPLCVQCYHRERRWRIAHQLPTRSDAA
jgi:hypothetical protein